MNNIDNSLIRITGFNSKGQEYLNKIKKDTNYFTKLINGINSVYDKEIMIAKVFSNVFNEDFIKIEQQIPYKK